MNLDVRLREVTEADLPVFFEHQLDPDATRMAAFPARGRDDFTAHWTKILADGAVTKRTILFEGHVAGNIVGYEHEGKPQVGYWIGKDFWGRGIATRALSEFLPVLRERPLYAHVAMHNIASLRVLEKCGFQIWGRSKAPFDAAGGEVEELILRLEASA